MALTAWYGQLHFCARYVVMLDDASELFPRASSSRLEYEVSRMGLWQRKGPEHARTERDVKRRILLMMPALQMEVHIGSRLGR